MLSDMQRARIISILLLALCGLSDALYIAQAETSNTPFLCNIKELSGCNIVAASQYSQLFGIPIVEYGIAFYAVVFFVAALELALAHRLLRRTLKGVAAIGIIVSAYLTYLELFVIHVLCVYCLVSAFIASIIFIVALFIEPTRLRAVRAPSDSPVPPSLPMPPSVNRV